MYLLEKMLVMLYVSRTELRAKHALSNGRCINVLVLINISHDSSLVSSLLDCLLLPDTSQMEFYFVRACPIQCLMIIL